MSRSDRFGNLFVALVSLLLSAALCVGGTTFCEQVGAVAIAACSGFLLGFCVGDSQ